MVGPNKMISGRFESIGFEEEPTVVEEAFVMFRIDFEAPEEFEAWVNALVETAAQRGFTVDGHLFDMVGRCATCS